MKYIYVPVSLICFIDIYVPVSLVIVEKVLLNPLTTISITFVSTLFSESELHKQVVSIIVSHKQLYKPFKFM